MRYVVIAMLLLQARAAVAGPSVGMFGDYTFEHPDFSNVRLSTGDHLNGWSVGGDVRVVGLLGAFGRVDGAYGDSFKTGAIFIRAGSIDRTSMYDVVAGPRVVWTAGRVSPWADAAFGATHVTARAMAIDAFVPVTDTAFTTGAGGGVDVRVTRWLDARIVDLEYRHATIFGQTLNRTTVSVGAVLHP